MREPAEARVKVKAQVHLGNLIAIGPGKADLLDAIDRSGSISAAGRSLGISYRRTRDMIDALNACWGQPVIRTAKGGQSGGGSHLTERGREVLAAYRKLDAALHTVTEMHAPALLALLATVEAQD